MKLSGARAAKFAEAPGADLRGALLYGPDAALVARHRRALVAAVTEGDDLRLDRIDPETARKSPADLHAAVKARGFFPGRRAVLVEGAKDGAAPALAGVLEEATAEDALLIVTADQLPASSRLRKLFEGPGDLAALAFYPDAPDFQDLVARLRRAGVTLDPEAEARLAEIASRTEPATVDGLVETLALYAIGRETPLRSEEIAALAPDGAAVDLDTLVDAVTRGAPERVGPLIARLMAQGGRAQGMLAALRLHLRQAMAALADPAGPRAAAERFYRGRFNPRRDAFLARLPGWDLARAEYAARLVFETERRLRSPGQRPEAAIVERLCLRLAFLPRPR